MAVADDIKRVRAALERTWGTGGDPNFDPRPAFDRLVRAFEAVAEHLGTTLDDSLWEQSAHLMRRAMNAKADLKELEEKADRIDENRLAHMKTITELRDQLTRTEHWLEEFKSATAHQTVQLLKTEQERDDALVQVRALTTITVEP